MINKQLVYKYSSRVFAAEVVNRKLDLRYELDTVLDKLNIEIESKIEL